MAKIPQGYRLTRISYTNVGIKDETYQRLKAMREKGKIKSINSFVQRAVEEKLSRRTL